VRLARLVPPYPKPRLLPFARRHLLPFTKRWSIRLVKFTLVSALLLTAAGLGVLKAILAMPLPSPTVPDQVSIVTYSDGSPLATLGAWHQVDVPLAHVPLGVQHAVLAAENRGFYHDAGLSITGTLRAAIVNVRGGDTQGGSTISQQYVKNAYLSPQRTITRKLREAAISVKLNHDYPKSQILEWYLNTICFGRGAYGIYAAAETYFGKQPGSLTVAEGAVLAASIRSPALYDPIAHPKEARDRWDFVLAGMVSQGWLSAADRATLRYPHVLRPGAGLFDENAGPNGLLLRQVREEMDRLGLDESLLGRGHLRVQTTVDSHAQPAAIRSVRGFTNGQPANLRAALMAVEPATGAIRAYYGGADGTGVDYLQAARQPGSTFKPFALAAAVERGTSPFAMYDGSSPRTFYGMPHPIHNDDNEQCPKCTLIEATTRSINTAYYELAQQVGGRAIADVAHRLGIPAKDARGKPSLQERNGTVLAQIVLGKYEVRPYDLTTAYATLAAGGTKHPPYLIERITTDTGAVLYQHRAVPGVFAVYGGVADDTALAMQDVAAYNGHALAGGRPAAAKTGTVGLNGRDNKDAWMAGFTPQLASVVWVGTDRNKPIRTATGTPIKGGTVPAAIWQRFMSSALAARPVDTRLTLSPLSTAEAERRAKYLVLVTGRAPSVPVMPPPAGVSLSDAGIRWPPRPTER
jgi:membrane peptidoglycan carboxypeptidase